MKNRPEHAVRVMKIKLVVFFFAEVGKDELHAVITEDVYAPGLVFNDLSAPAQPDAAGIL